MGRLLNHCRWSASREGTFNECRKKYWYTYYGAWEGWPKTPYDTRTAVDPLATYLYRLKNIQSTAIFVGSTVHKAIEWALQQTQKTQMLPPLQSLKTQITKLIQNGSEESKNKAWQKHPKHHVNLLEEYYQLSLPSSEELVNRALKCVNNWYTSPCVQNLILHHNALWMGIETPHTFSIEPGIEAIVVFDFYLKWKDRMIIFDWKTGKESPKIEFQLYTYALAASTLFHVPYSSLILSPFYIAEGPTAYKKYGQNPPLIQEQLNETKQAIITSARQMLAVHPQKDAQGLIPTPEPALFAYTTERYLCQRCPFQEICQKADYLEKSCVELKELALQML